MRNSSKAFSPPRRVDAGSDRATVTFGVRGGLTGPFTWAGLGQAEEALRRLTDFLARAERTSEEGSHADVRARIDEAVESFTAAMRHDLNTAAALAAMFDLVRALNSAMDAGQFGTGDVPAVRDAFARFDQVLGVLSLRQAEDTKPPVPVDEIERLIGTDTHAGPISTLRFPSARAVPSSAATGPSRAAAIGNHAIPALRCMAGDPTRSTGSSTPSRSGSAAR